MASIKVTVRDGRAGCVGGEAGVTPDRWGEVLAEFEQPRPLNEGDTLILGDGSKVVVIGLTERISDMSYEQTVHVGNFLVPR